MTSHFQKYPIYSIHKLSHSSFWFLLLIHFSILTVLFLFVLTPFNHSITKNPVKNICERDIHKDKAKMFCLNFSFPKLKISHSKPIFWRSTPFNWLVFWVTNFQYKCHSFQPELIQNIFFMMLRLLILTCTCFFSLNPWGTSFNRVSTCTWRINLPDTVKWWTLFLFWFGWYFQWHEWLIRPKLHF